MPAGIRHAQAEREPSIRSARPRSADASYGTAYFRILGEGAGRALKPLLMNAGGDASGSEWDRVRGGLEIVNPWLARVVENLAGRLPEDSPAPATAEEPTDPGENTAQHKPTHE